MGLFPLSDGLRSVPAAPGARRHDVTLDDVNRRLRAVLAGLPPDLQAALITRLPGGADDDPDLGPALAVCGPRLLLERDLAILPPELRFNSTRRYGVHRIFAAKRWINGVNGYAIAPSDFRPEMSVWAHSEALVADGVELEPELVDKLTQQAADLWERIESDLPDPQPRPSWDHPGDEWAGELVAGRPHGRWTMTDDGVVVREEHYRDGLRHGPTTRWHLADQVKQQYAALSMEQLREIDDDWLESVRGAVERVGVFVDGAAHGEFRFFDKKGRPLQEGHYERGWPEGRWTVHPEATRGLADAASVEYSAGIPVSWTIPPLAFDAVQVERGDTPVGPLASLAPGADGVIVVNCAQTSEHDLAEGDTQDLAGLPNVLVVGVHPDSPGRGRFGGRPIEVVADPAARLTRAYGTHHEHLTLLTFLDGQGSLLGGSDKLARLRLPKWFESGGDR